MKGVFLLLLVLLPKGLFALDVIIPNVDVPVGCYPGGKFIYHMYDVVMITGLETNGEYYIRRWDNLDFTPPLTYIELLYYPGDDIILRDDFEIIDYDSEEGWKYRYTGTSSIAYFDYNFEIPNEGLIVGEYTTRPAIRIRKTWTTNVIVRRSTITIINPSSISGTALTCNGSGSYYIQDQPYGSSISWVIKQNGNIRAQGTGTSAQASNLTNGSVNVEFTLNFSCGLYQIIMQKDFWSGVPGAPSTYPSGFPPEPMGIYSYQDIVLIGYPGANFWDANWSSSGSVNTVWSEGQTGRFYSFEEGGAYFYVTTFNSCGNSPMYQGEIIVYGDQMDKIFQDDEELSWTISPNPASTYFDLSIKSNDIDLLKIYRIEIFDPYTRLIKSIKLAGPENQIYLQNLIAGNYIVKLTINGIAYQKVLMIQK